MYLQWNITQSLKRLNTALASVAQLVGHHSTNQKVMGFSPGQAT